MTREVECFLQCAWCMGPCSPGEWTAIVEEGVPGVVHTTECLDEFNDRTQPLAGSDR